MRHEPDIEAIQEQEVEPASKADTHQPCKPLSPQKRKKLRKQARQNNKRKRVRVLKGGRPRAKGEREPNGRISRKTDIVHHRKRLEIRARHFSIPKADAQRPECGYALGRLWIAGRLGSRRNFHDLSRKRLEAGNQFAADYDQLWRLKGMPKRSPQSLDYDFVPGGLHTSLKLEDSERVQKAQKRLNDAVAVVRSQPMGKEAFQLLCTVTVFDFDPLHHWTDPMYGWLNKGLDALAKHYGLSANGPQESAGEVTGRII